MPKANLIKQPKERNQNGITCVEDFVKLRSRAINLLATLKIKERKLISENKLKSHKIGNTLIAGSGEMYSELLDRYETKL